MIFCVEDDSGIRDLMAYTFNASGLPAAGFCDGAELFSAISEGNLPNLIMLNIMLPGEDGISILKRPKAQRITQDIPVIMATAKGSEYDKVIGLNLGADDYLAKPFDMMETVSRIKAVLRGTSKKKGKKLLRVGALELNTAEHAVTVYGKMVKLTLKEYELLRLFMTEPGRVYARDTLLKLVWSSDYVGETRIVDVHIGTLGTKLKDCGEYIETIRGVGYRMETRV